MTNWAPHTFTIMSVWVGVALVAACIIAALVRSREDIDSRISGLDDWKVNGNGDFEP